MDMEGKKLTNGQLQRRLKNALVHIDKTKETKSVYYDDKGLRLTFNDDYAIVETNYHKHVFDAYSGGGVSMPWLYIKRIVETTLENECTSYDALLKKLQSKKDKKDYNFAFYVSWWLFNIFTPLYSIGNSDAEFFFVYEDYIYNIAKNSVILSERESDMTNKQFLEQLIERMKEYSKDIEEVVLLKKLTDEEYIQENINAAQQDELEKAINEQINESKD